MVCNSFCYLLLGEVCSYLSKLVHEVQVKDMVYVTAYIGELVLRCGMVASGTYQGVGTCPVSRDSFNYLPQILSHGIRHPIGYSIPLG